MLLLSWSRARKASRVARLPLLALPLAHALAACTGKGDAVSAPAALSASTNASAPDAATVHPPLGVRLAPTAPARPPRAMTPAALAGKEIFFDKRLSASRTMSCATCHDPAHAYGPPNDLGVQLGGPKGISPGLRAVPSIRYKEYTPGYADTLDNPDGVSQPAPGGGFAWDGRADSLAEQAKAPLLSPFEMANASPADVVAALRASPSAEAFLHAFGPGALEDVNAAFEKVTQALQAFQIEDPSFHPYSSKFDLNEQKKPGGTFTPAEERGLKVFVDPKKGNCAGCHFNGPGFLDGSSGMFTDYSFEAIGVPRNDAIPANRERAYVDLGICGPERKDRPLKARTNPFCGMFKTPTLRNAATRHVFFHNGVIHSLEQAVRFYNTRDTTPQIWYPTADGKAKATPDASFPRYGLITTQYVGGTVQKFDDLPPAHRANLDAQMPLDGRPVGSTPPMTEQEVTDLTCFLETLTDDYRPGPPAPSSRCVQ